MCGRALTVCLDVRAALRGDLAHGGGQGLRSRPQLLHVGNHLFKRVNVVCDADSILC